MSTTGNTNEPKMLVCGKHERVSAIPGARKRKITRPLRAFVPGEKQESCICDYTEFSKLLKERLDDRAREVSWIVPFCCQEECVLLTT